VSDRRNGSATLRRLRDAEAAVGELTADEAELTAGARTLLGVTGRAERFPIGPTLRASRTGWYPLVAITALAAADAAAMAVLPLARHEIRRSLGGGALGSYAVFAVAAFAAGALLVLQALPRRPGSRATVARTAAVVAAAGVTMTALATSSVAALAGALVAAAASGATTVVLAPMLVDAHRPEVRVRAASVFAAAVALGSSAAALVIAVGTGIGITWRSQLLAVAALSIAAAAVAVRLGDPVVGRFDRGRVTDAVRRHLGGSADARGELDEREVALSTAQQFRRVLAARPVRELLLTALVFGAAVRTLPGFLDTFLLDRWGMVANGRVLVLALLWLAALPGLAWFGPHAEVLLRIGPSRFVSLAASTALAGAAALGLAAVAPVFALTALSLAAAFAALGILFAATIAGVLVLVEPVRRGHAAALVGVAVVAGALLGQQQLATIGDRFGVAWALEIGAAALLAVGGAVGRAVPLADEELDRLVGRMVEADELAVRVGQGQHLPLLSCRHVSFSYGQVQVLFDVSFTVDDGEMVALLGTNGAGKSTLLRLISGLSLPDAGAVHYRGADITFVDSDRRVQLGISQVPGGKAVFGPMSVVDNLRAYGYSVGRDRARLERGIEEAFEAFPRLAERRNQLASTLSGGEQQMLALSAALILDPRLLLIDELSLGLAPKVVGELLEMVRRINERGTAVVLVEQSVNVALSVVDHAYFMEKGEVRFDGPAAELLARPDLLRSVFLQGATKAMEATA
jgi:ABC-type branched-subunit amino acid transport system ATPase component